MIVKKKIEEKRKKLDQPFISFYSDETARGFVGPTIYIWSQAHRLRICGT